MIKIEVFDDMLYETREEATIQSLMGHINALEDTIKRQSETIKALEQEPCEDAISRQAVLDIIDSDWKYECMGQDVKALPSVTPTRKKRKWIKTSYWYSNYCSECEYKSETRTNYCPNCGAEMESE